MAVPLQGGRHLAARFIEATRSQATSWLIAHKQVKTLLFLIGWCILFVLCWPPALLALIVWPVVWLISIPLKLIGITIGAALALVKTVLFLPARMLGYHG
jgi:uncharacterized Tic20 family protein